MMVVTVCSHLMDISSYEKFFVVPFISIALVIFSLGLLKKLYFNRKIKSDRKAVLITGCDSGFGHEFARRLDSKGFHVFATCMLPSGSGALKLKECCSSKLNILHMDVTKDESVKKAYECVKENLGTSEMWAIVNNAGTGRGFSFDFCTMQDFEDCVNVNFLGMVRVTKAFLPLLKQTKGRIVNITSLVGEMPVPLLSPYVSSKYAAVGFTDCLRQELDPLGIVVVSIEPGIFKTGMTSPEYLEKLKDSTVEHFDRALTEDSAASLDKLINFLISIASDKLSIVADDLEAAVSLVHPCYTYKPRRNAIIRFLFFTYEVMPRSCQLFIATKFILPNINSSYLKKIVKILL